VRVRRKRIPIIGRRYTKACEAEEDLGQEDQEGATKKVAVSRLQSSRWSIYDITISLTLPYLRGGHWTGSYTCPALRPYQFGPLRVPECNHKVIGSGYKAVVGCEAETSTKALVTCSNLLSRVWSALS